MRNIIVIAKNTFKETIRDRILYAILIFALLFIIFTTFLGSISLGEDIRIIKSFGLAGIYLFGMIITIFLGGSLLYKEMQQRTLYFVLSKPVSHTEVMLGKFAGLFSSSTLATIFMALVYLGVVRLASGAFDTPALLALFLQILEMSIFVALTIFFSTFSVPLASTIYALMTLYIGHSLPILFEATRKSSWIVAHTIQFLYYTFPNLEKFNIRDMVIYQVPIPLLSLISASSYAVLYIALLLYLAILLFRRREF